MTESFKPVEIKKLAKSFNLHLSEQAHQMPAMVDFPDFWRLLPVARVCLGKSFPPRFFGTGAPVGDKAGLPSHNYSG
jgi:hypothetical protein